MENQRICKYCGEIIEDGDDIVTVYDRNGDADEAHAYCAELHECFTCKDCGKTFEKDCEIYTTHYDEIICEECYQDNYFYCEHCEEFYSINEINHAPDGWCYCDDCFNELFVSCAHCGEVIERNNAYYSDDADDYFCEECYCELNEEDDERIYSYHDFNDWREYKTETEGKPPFYIGFELEVEHKDNNAHAQSETLDILENNLNVVFMHDGSLNDHGFEIISHPQSFNYIFEHKEKYVDTFKKMVENGYISHDSSHCGLHFHFTAPEEEKRKEVIERIWIILETYKEQISQLSRRHGAFSYCQFLSNTSELRDKNEDGLFYYIKKADTTRERYLALNSLNRRTLEFRFFRGTLNANTFFADIEFVNNLYTITNNLDIKLTDINWNDLIKGAYIKEYCEKNNILTDKKIVDNSLKYIELENKINRLKTHISSILTKKIKEKYNAILTNINFEKCKNIKDLTDNAYTLKGEFYIFNEYTRAIKYLINADDIKEYKYYFNDNETKRAFDYFLTLLELEKINKKYEKIKIYYEKIQRGII